MEFWVVKADFSWLWFYLELWENGTMHARMHHISSGRLLWMRKRIIHVQTLFVAFKCKSTSCPESCNACSWGSRPLQVNSPACFAFVFFFLYLCKYVCLISLRQVWKFDGTWIGRRFSLKMSWWVLDYAQDQAVDHANMQLEKMIK